MSSIKSESISDMKPSKQKGLWPEWSDSEYNSIRWDPYIKDKPTSSKHLYTDPNEFLLPYSLQTKVVEWVRTYEFFQNVSDLILYQDCDLYSYANVIELNCHLMSSPIMRLILSSFGLAQYFGDRYTTKMPMFFQNPTMLWRPWYHLYSFGKLRKDSHTEPLWNANGMCVARLYYAGSWYLIRMDDYIPIDAEGRALLPMIRNSNKESDAVVLWPLFLTKALLKVAALSWGVNYEIVDFSPIHCFTGWLYEKVNLRGLDRMEKWNICRPYATVYTWDEEDVKVENSSKNPKSKGSTKRIASGQSVAPEKQTFLCAQFKDMSFVEADEHDTNIAPSFGHLCYIEQTRDCLLDKPERMPELERWKSYRWLEWAREHGLYPPDPFDPSAHALEVMSTFRKSLALHELEEAEGEISHPMTPASYKKNDKKKSKVALVPLIKPPLVWCNFNSIHKYISEIHIFFTLGANQANWTVSPKMEEREKKEKKPKSAATSFAEAETLRQNETLLWPNHLLLSKNCPIYLFVDSLATKSLLFCLQHRNIRFDTEKDSGDDVPIITKYTTHRSKASILLEKFTFEKTQFGDVEFFINTMGVTSKSITIPEGRFVYRIWLRSDTHYVFTLLSNTSVYLGKYFVAADLMSKIPMRLQEFSSTFSNAFSVYLNSIGFDDFKNAMHEFHQILQPDLIKSDKKLKNKINEAIMEILYDLCQICDHPTEAKRGLDVLFGPSIHSPLIEDYSVEDSAARKIQAKFKGFYVRRILEKRKIFHGQYDSIQFCLRVFYERFFNIENRLWTVPRIFLAFMKKIECHEYSIYSDYSYYIVPYVFRNPQRPKVEAYSWSPLVFCKFHVPKPIFLRVCMQTELTTQIVRVFDNDTFLEMPRVAGNVKPQKYNVNLKGYTILAYGWNYEQTDISDNVWQLQIAHLLTEDMESTLLRCDFKDCVKTQLEGVYYPNYASHVCSCYISIKSNTMAAIRVGTTYELAKIHAQLMTPNGTVVSEMAGEHVVVIPLTFLQHGGIPKGVNSRTIRPMSEGYAESTTELTFIPTKHNESLSTFAPDRDIIRVTSGKQFKETRYYLKVKVLDNSWPCTTSEWMGIQEYKNSKLLKVPTEDKDSNDSKERNIFTSSVTIREQKRSLTRKIPKYAPSWVVNVLSTDPVSLIPDNENDERIMQMKLSWENNNPGRLLKATRLREAFLRENPKEDSYSITVMPSQKKMHSSKHQSIKEERSLIPFSRLIPRLNINDYQRTSETYDFMKKLLLETNKRILSTEKYYLKTPEDELSRHYFREMQIQDFQKRNQMEDNFMQAFLNCHSRRFGSVYVDLEENILKSEDLSWDAYDTRRYIFEMDLKTIESKKHVFPPVTPSETEEKGKRGRRSRPEYQA